MPIAEIITIGTELLLGEIVDTNSRDIARSLRDIGVDLYIKTTVGDNPLRIAQAIQQSMQRSDIIITTGGLGPTIDDPTREGVSTALGREIEFRPELWQQIKSRFEKFNRKPTENNKRQAYIPEGAIPVENPVGTAPAFIIDTKDNAIISLPGVPSEMEYLFKNNIEPYLIKRYRLTGIIKTRIIHTIGAGESQIDSIITDLEKQQNPTVGLSAHTGQVDVRITAKADSEERADSLIREVEIEIEQRLHNWIYGFDQDKIEEVALNTLQSKGWSLAVVEAGLNGFLIQPLSVNQDVFLGGKTLQPIPPADSLLDETTSFQRIHRADVGMGVAIYPGEGKQEVKIAVTSPNGTHIHSHPYAGPPKNTPTWALHHCLDILRKL